MRRILHQKLIALSLATVLGLALGQDAHAAAKKSYPTLFNSTERKFKSMKAFKKWTGMLSRYESEKPVDGRPCDPFFHESCDLDQWTKFIGTLEGKSRLEIIQAINDYQNNAKYLTDPVNWKVEDYWGTPGEFFARNGDCEDFAIAKYMSLRKLGFGPEDMRILVVQDLNLRVGHAVLAVYVDDQAYILDNQVSEVLEESRIRHYRMHYSINEEYWWRHRH